MNRMQFVPCLLAFSMAAHAQAPISDRQFADSLRGGDKAPEPRTIIGRPVDGLGREVGGEALAAFTRVMSSVKKRALSAEEQSFLLTLLNNPPMDPGPFKNREALALHFAQKGVGLGEVRSGGLAGTDMWRLVRSARAASQAFSIPPAILLCLTFQESGFAREASAWTTSAKGVSQMTNPAVGYITWMIQHDKKRIKPAAEEYARLLGAKMPERFEGTPDVDRLTKELESLKKEGAPAAAIKAKKDERRRAIRAHKDEPGSIFNIETNFGLGAAYLADIRYNHLQEVPEEKKAWLTAVGGYNQGMGIANELIYDVFEGPEKFNKAALDSIFNAATLSRLSVSKEFQEEMLGEVGNVRRCALP